MFLEALENILRAWLAAGQVGGVANSSRYGRLVWLLHLASLETYPGEVTSVGVEVLEESLASEVEAQ